MTKVTTMEESFESLYLLILMLIIWGFSFVIGVILSSDIVMVFFFWILSILIIAVYSTIYKKKERFGNLKRELILLTPIWLFLIYQSYVTLKKVQMTSMERWALIPFVLGLGFYVALLKQNVEKKEKR